MRTIAAVTISFLGVTTAAMAQSSDSGDAALTYHWVRPNAPPGNCGCFGLNGGGISGSWNFKPRIAAVAEISAEHAGNVLSTSGSLTLTSILAGARYRLPQP
jgi:outer membrane immunogenic protein